MRNSWNNPQTKALFVAILRLKTPLEARKFLRDLLTEDELIEFGKRWQAARMLNAGAPYTAIENHIGLSSRTIARISWWLEKGMGGYRLMLARLRHHTAYPRLSR
ncbi:MAG: TrpR-like protein YerC/YecD [Candidatus Kerfeldbacteria bacterium]|nr:TrpR-like protein YerC/YecD [Candidatus Kerfeldbacteria bacterium]